MLLQYGTFKRLKMCEGKLSRTVLMELGDGYISRLPGIWLKRFLYELLLVNK